MGNDLSCIGKKVELHLVSTRKIEKELRKLFSSVYMRQQRTLLSNPIQNPKNDRHYMVVISRGKNRPLTLLCRLVISSKDLEQEKCHIPKPYPRL